MKKFILLVLAGVALFVFIFTTSILWYRFFYGEGSINNSSLINIEISNTNNVLDESGLIPIDDNTALSLKPYEFKVTNFSDNDSVYNVLL